MADENTQEGGAELSPETLALAAVGRGEEAPLVVDEGTDKGADEIPAWVPEKFRKDGKADFESLAKAYGELEKKLGQPKDADPAEEAAEGDEETGDEEDTGSAEEAAAAIPAELFSTAQSEWAEKGELTSETREKIISSGIPGETLDTYLAGVKALSEALTQSVYTAAGGEEAYTAAVEWAREKWPAGQIEKFDAAITDPDLMPVMVKALMADYSEANPGEGTQTRAGSGSVNDGDLYHDSAEFTRDLQEADQKNDALGRQKAVKKLERSKKAGTLKHVTPRTGVSQLLG